MVNNGISFMDAIGSLEPEPKDVFNYFQELSELPREPKNLERVVAYLLAFADKNGLEAATDAHNNVVICRAASSGMEDKPAVILQAHTDVLIQRTQNNGESDDAAVSPIVKGDWMVANGSSVGADDGIGCAMILAILADKESHYPKIEALFTADHELSLRGVMNIEDNLLSELDAERCINIDNTDENSIVVESAGGLTVDTEFPIRRKNFTGGIRCRLTVSGLLGGSSSDVAKGRGNGLMLLGRVLYELFHTAPLRLISIKGASHFNVIPVNAEAEFVTTSKGIPRITDITEKMQDILVEEFQELEPDLQIRLEIQDRDSLKDNADSEAVEESLQSTSRNTSDVDSFWQKAEKRQVVMHTNTVVSAGTQLPPESDVRIYRRYGVTDSLETPLDEKSTSKILNFFMCVPRDVVSTNNRYSSIPEGCAVTSEVEIRRNEFRASTQLRSFSETRKYFAAERIETLALMLGGDVMTDDNYHAWHNGGRSSLSKEYADAYADVTGNSTTESATLNGLECSILEEKFGRNLEMISVGPTIEGSHSPREKVLVNSVQNVYESLKKLLECK